MLLHFNGDILFKIRFDEKLIFSSLDSYHEVVAEQFYIRHDIVERICEIW